jgi:hypothetical protein
MVQSTHAALAPRRCFLTKHDRVVWVEKIMQTEVAHYTLVPILNVEDGDGSSAVDVDSM